MTTAWASWVLGALGVYAAVGAAFALVFVLIGVSRIDPGAHGAPPGFRLLILPGVTLFWPLLLRRWLAGVGKPLEERNAHRVVVRR